MKFYITETAPVKLALSNNRCARFVKDPINYTEYHAKDVIIIIQTSFRTVNVRDSEGELFQAEIFLKPTTAYVGYTYGDKSEFSQHVLEQTIEREQRSGMTNEDVLHVIWYKEDELEE